MVALVYITGEQR